MFAHHTVSLLAAAALSSTCFAQSILTLPSEYDRCWGSGGASSAMIGQNVSRTQMIFVSPFAPGTVVTGFGIRAAPTIVDNAAFTATIEIRASTTAAVPGALNSTFANNIGNDEVVVLPQQVVAIPAMPANRGTGEFADFTFTTPFVFGTNGNPNICIDFLVYGRSVGAAWDTDRAFAGTNGSAKNHGIGCGTGTPNSTSTNGSYVDGSTINFTVSGGLPNTLMLLVLSIDLKEFAPGVPLPLPLILVGSAPGCDLMNALNGATLATVSDPAGASAIPVTISGFSSFGLGGQWAAMIPPTPANPLGIEVLRNRAIWIGPTVVVPNAQYVYDLFSNSDGTGTATTNSVPVVCFHIQ